MRLLIRLLAVMIVGFAAMRDASTLLGQMLDDELRGVPAADLARQALAEGDAQRGAVLFFQRHMGCAKCHAVNGGEASLLGPDLATLEREVDDVTVVEALLAPSKRIRKGFDAVTVIKVDGQSQVGLLVERNNEKLVLRGVGTGEGVITLPISEVEEIKDSPLSIMPAGQANQLASRQQFLDLVRYVIEVRDGGAKRARELQPPDTLLIDVLPEYEEHIDHAGIIGSWNDASLKRGEAIYQRVCANCHGTKEQPGSLPTSLRFADGKFKNGSDPLAMYQTLTRGFGLMAPKRWMVPSQKYDVIHYIRETYLRPHNPSQLADVDAKYSTRDCPKATRAGRSRASRTVERDGLWAKPHAHLRSAGQGSQCGEQRNCHSARSGSWRSFARTPLDSVRHRHAARRRSVERQRRPRELHRLARHSIQWRASSSSAHRRRCGDCEFDGAGLGKSAKWLIPRRRTGRRPRRLALWPAAARLGEIPRHISLRAAGHPVVFRRRDVDSRIAATADARRFAEHARVSPHA